MRPSRAQRQRASRSATFDPQAGLGHHADAVMQDRAHGHLHVEVVALVARQAVFDRIQPCHTRVRQHIQQGIRQQVAGVAVAVFAGDLRAANRRDDGKR